MMKVIRKFGGFLIWINKVCWQRTPESIRQSRFGLFWGQWIFRLIGIKGGRNQLTTTYFFRNRAEIQQWLDVVERLMPVPELNISIIGCSEGAEVYTIIYTIKKRFPAVNLQIRGYDINKTAITIAKDGRYPADSRLLSKMEPNELEDLFDKEGNFVRVKSQYRDGVQWELQDPTQDSVLSSSPKQGIVFANRLLFHMYLNDQRRALKAIGSMVRPGGYLFVSGADLDVRTKLARESGWIPVTDLVDEIHAGDETMTVDWPFKYWGLEPLDKRRKNWLLRYCAVFQIT